MSIVPPGSEHRALQPRLGELPITHDGLRRNFHDAGGFLDAQPAEEPQLNNFALALVETGQGLQRIIEHHDVVPSFIADYKGFVEIDSRGEATALFRPPRPGMVDEDPAHHLRARGQKMRAVVEGDRPGIHQPNEGLVHERGGLQGVAGTLARHVPARDLVHFAVDQRHEVVERRFITGTPPIQQCRDRGRIRQPVGIGTGRCH